MGYCAPTKQVFDGDYEIFYPLLKDEATQDCVLQLKGTQAGVYSCSVKYPTVDVLTSAKTVEIEGKNDNVVIGLSTTVGFLSVAICIIAIIPIIIWIKRRCNGFIRLNDQQPAHAQ